MLKGGRARCVFCPTLLRELMMSEWRREEGGRLHASLHQHETTVFIVWIANFHAYTPALVHIQKSNRVTRITYTPRNEIHIKKR